MTSENYGARVVAVRGRRSADGTHVSGSGFRVSDEAIVTVRHIVEDVSDLMVLAPHVGGDWVDATLHCASEGLDPRLDVALLTTARGALPLPAEAPPPWTRLRGDRPIGTVEVEGLGFPAKTTQDSFLDTFHIRGSVAADAYTRARHGGRIRVRVDGARSTPRGVEWEGASGTVLVTVATGHVVGVVTELVGADELTVAALGILPALAGRLGVRVAEWIDRRWARWALPPARDVDPVALGVLPAAGEDPAPPAYVRRTDHDRAVLQLRDHGCMVISGDAAAGKTRLAYEVLREVYPDRTILRPADAAELRAVIAEEPQEFVVWLDNLERYLDGDGLTAVAVERLCKDGRNALVATLRTQARRRLADGPSEQRAALAALGASLYVAPVLDKDERERALRTPDRRVHFALRDAYHHGFGVRLGRCLEAALEWQRERTNGRFGAHLVAAAVDFRRAGYHEPVNREVLVRAARTYAAGSAGSHAPGGFAGCDAVNIDDEIEWACSTEDTPVPLLIESGGGLRAFDFLVDTAQRNHAGHAPVGDAIWTAVLDLATPPQCAAVGRAAVEFWNRDIADQAFTTGMAGEDAECAAELGVLVRRSDPARAEAAFRAAIRLGKGTDPVATDARIHLVRLLTGQGRVSEAVACLEGPARHEAAAAVLLARLSTEDSPDRAARLLADAAETSRRARANGDRAVVFSYGSALLRCEWRDEGVAALKVAHEMGHPDAALTLALWLEPERDGDTALFYCEAAAGLGHSGAALNLGVHLCRAGDIEAGIEAYRRAIDLGDLGVAGNLGLALEDLDRPDEAAAEWKRAADRGYPGPAYFYGMGRKKAGDAETAVHYLTIAAESFRRELRFENGAASAFLPNVLRALDWPEKAIAQEMATLTVSQAAARGTREVAE